MDAFFLPVFVLLIVAGISYGLWKEWRKSALREATVVAKEGTEFPNNHHVLGVGYYHATCGAWHPFPWNEFREGSGYYWDGKWHPEPDKRTVLSSIPHPGEVARVNKEWRLADAHDAGEFWSDVERGGFGYALSRTKGS